MHAWVAVGYSPFVREAAGTTAKASILQRIGTLCPGMRHPAPQLSLHAKSAMPRRCIAAMHCSDAPLSCYLLLTLGTACCAAAALLCGVVHACRRRWGWEGAAAVGVGGGSAAEAHRGQRRWRRAARCGRTQARRSRGRARTGTRRRRRRRWGRPAAAPRGPGLGTRRRGARCGGGTSLSGRRPWSELLHAQVPGGATNCLRALHGGLPKDRPVQLCGRHSGTRCIATTRRRWGRVGLHVTRWSNVRNWWSSSMNVCMRLGRSDGFGAVGVSLEMHRSGGNSGAGGAGAMQLREETHTYRVVFCCNSQSCFHDVGFWLSAHDALNEDSSRLVRVHSCHVPLLPPFIRPAAASANTSTRISRCTCSYAIQLCL